MRIEKEKTNEMDELIAGIKLRSPGPSKEHSAEKSFSRLMTRIQTDSNSIDIFRRRKLLYPRDPILEPSPALRRRGNRPWRASTSTP